MTKKSEDSKIWYFAYGILGNKLDRLFPKFRGLRKNLQKALIRVSYRAYVALVFLTAILTFIASAVTVTVLLFLFTSLKILQMGFFSMLGLSLGISGIAALLAFMIMYNYPALKAKTRKGKLDNELPYTASYLSILSSAGSSPDKLFISLSTAKTMPSSTEDANVILRDTKLLGKDMFSAVKTAADRSPSPRYTLFMEGLIATIRSGGDMTQYLNDESKELMRTRTMEMHQFLDSLGLMAEMYITLLVAFPLILIIMLGVMSTLGGAMGGMSITAIMYMLTYLAIPFLAMVVILLIDAMSPK